MKNPFLVPGILLVLLLMEEWVKRDSVLIEKVYSKGIYPIVIKGLNGLSGSVPFSLFEAVLCVLLLFILAALGVLAWRAAHRRTEQVRWRNAALRSLSLIMVFVILFNLLWGFNYYRLPLSEQMGATVEKHSSLDLSLLCESLISEANVLSEYVNRGSDGAMAHSGTLAEVLARTAVGYQRANERLGLFEGRYATPKTVWNSTAMSYLGIAGMYSPYTGEANVNGLIPAPFFPATAMHELAHVYGYSREDEANFIAWLSCRFHPDGDYRYSGALLGLVYGMNALHDADPEEYKRLKAQYSPGVKADLAANRTFWERYEGPAEELHEKVNDRYLKANGQTDGVDSYGRMVDLMLEAHGGSLKISGLK